MAISFGYKVQTCLRCLLRRSFDIYIEICGGGKNGKYCNINFCSALWHYIATLFSLVSVLLPGTDNSNPILRLQMRRKRATSKDAPFAKVFLAIVLTKEFIYKIDALVVM